MCCCLKDRVTPFGVPELPEVKSIKEPRSSRSDTIRPEEERNVLMGLVLFGNREEEEEDVVSTDSNDSTGHHEKFVKELVLQSSLPFALICTKSCTEDVECIVEHSTMLDKLLESHTNAMAWP